MSNNLGPLGGGALARALEANMALTSLDLADNNLSAYEQDFTGVEALVRALSVNWVLRRVECAPRRPPRRPAAATAPPRDGEPRPPSRMLPCHRSNVPSGLSLCGPCLAAAYGTTACGRSTRRDFRPRSGGARSSRASHHWRC
jgi:hypothetical protein